MLLVIARFYFMCLKKYFDKSYFVTVNTYVTMFTELIVEIRLGESVTFDKFYESTVPCNRTIRTLCHQQIN